VDIDGTVAKMGVRDPFDETRVHEDQPHVDVIDLVQILQLRGYRVIFMSGRTSACRAETERWLNFHYKGNSGMYYYDHLYMRAKGDGRPDHVVKLELFDKYIRHVYDVRYVLDDRNKVVEMWRSIGLRVLQVAPGAF
jgi:hypothetical protein